MSSKKRNNKKRAIDYQSKQRRKEWVIKARANGTFAKWLENKIASKNKYKESLDVISIDFGVSNNIHWFGNFRDNGIDIPRARRYGGVVIPYGSDNKKEPSC